MTQPIRFSLEIDPSGAPAAIQQTQGALDNLGKAGIGAAQRLSETFTAIQDRMTVGAQRMADLQSRFNDAQTKRANIIIDPDAAGRADAAVAALDRQMADLNLSMDRDATVADRVRQALADLVTGLNAAAAAEKRMQEAGAQLTATRTQIETDANTRLTALHARVNALGQLHIAPEDSAFAEYMKRAVAAFRQQEEAFADVTQHRLAAASVTPRDDAAAARAVENFRNIENQADRALKAMENSLNTIDRRVAQGVKGNNAGDQIFGRMISDSRAFEGQITVLERQLREFQAQINALPSDAKGLNGLKSQAEALQRQLEQMQRQSAQRLGGINVDPTTAREADAAFRQLLSTENQFAGASRNVEDGLSRMERGLQTAGTAATEAESKFGKFLSRAASQALGNIWSSILMSVGQAVRNTGAELVQSAQDQEQWLATYTRLLGSVDAAKAHVAEVRATAVTAPQELPEIVAMDQRLIELLGKPQQIEDRFHKSLTVVRQDLLDTAAAVKGIDPTNLAKALNQLTEGQTGLALRSLRLVGVTREGLAQQGVQFNAAGTKILSDYDGAVTAAINIMEQKFGGMGEVQSRTFAGMIANVRDFARNAANTLGGPFLEEARQRLGQLLKDWQSPAFQATLTDWGDKLARVGHLAFTAFDTMVQGARVVAAALRPVTDAIGNLIGQLPRSTTAAKDFSDNLYAAAVRGATAMDTATDSTQYMSAATEELQGKLKDLGRASEDARRQNELAIQPWRDQATAATRAAEDIRAADDKANAPLKERITMLDRLNTAATKETEIANLRKTILHDTALGGDIYNSEGRAAALRLPEEQARLAAALRDQDTTAQKNALTDQISANDKKRDSDLSNNQKSQRAIADTITSLERAGQAAQDSFTKQQRAAQDALDAANAAAQATTHWGAAYKASTPWATAFQSAYDKTVAAITGGVPEQTGALDNLDKRLQALTVGSVQGLLDKIAGDKGLSFSVLALVDDWNLLRATWDQTPTTLEPVGKALGDLSRALGLDVGLAQDAVIASTAIKGLFETFALFTTPAFVEVGAMLEGAADDLRTAAATATLAMDVLTGQSADQLTRDKQALNAADAARTAGQSRRDAAILGANKEALGRLGPSLQQDLDAMQRQLAGIAAGAKIVDSGPVERNTNAPDFGKTTTTPGADFGTTGAQKAAPGAPADRNAPPPQPPPGRAAGTGQWILIGGAWVWRANDPTQAPAPPAGPASHDSRPPPSVVPQGYVPQSRTTINGLEDTHIVLDLKQPNGDTQSFRIALKGQQAYITALVADQVRSTRR